MNAIFNFEFEKDESDTGIPTLEFVTPEQRPWFFTRNIKASSQGLVFTGEAWPAYEWSTGTVSYRPSAPTPEPLFYAGTTQATRPDFMVSESRVRQNPPKTVQISIISNSTAFSKRGESLLEITKVFFQRLVDGYSKGRFDIPDIVSLLGKPWAESTVVLLLELLGARRSVFTGQLSTEDQKNVLGRLAEIRRTSEVEKFNSLGWIQREVIASQRIESVYVFPDDLAATT